MSRLVTGKPATRRMALEQNVLAYVRREGLFVPGERVLVAVSGGPDSVALLALLSALAPGLGLTLHAVHFNYGLRGGESDGDERFVKDLCTRLEIGLTTERLPIEDRASSLRGRSLQERARVARYDRLRVLAGRLGATRVALGHTADDHAETLCMWMVRGTGLTGLRGIPPSREDLFVRPLLSVDRAGILSYLAARELTYRTDSTNAKDLYFRNRIRHHVLPVLKRENPSLLGVWQRQADLLREDDRYLEEAARRAYRHLRVQAEAFCLRRSGINDLPLALQRRVIRLAVREARGDVRGASFRVVESIVRLARSAASGRRVVCRGLTVVAQGDELRFCVRSERNRDEAPRHSGQSADRTRVPVFAPATVRWESDGCSCVVHLDYQVFGPHDLFVSKGSEVRLDADRFSPDLVLRTWRPGDRFCPAGMGGHQQKLQDFFTNLKIPQLSRGAIPLLVAPEGILWVAGYRADHRFVAGTSTRRVLHAYLSGECTDHHVEADQ